jgi:hypothetical protein
MFLTWQQEKLLGLLRQCTFLRRKDVIEFFKQHRLSDFQAETSVEQLVRLRKVVVLDNDVLCRPLLSPKVPEQQLLQALSVMIQIGGSKIAAASLDEAPFTLTFAVEQSAVSCFAVLSVPDGSEQVQLSRLAQSKLPDCMVIFTLEHERQMGKISAALPHVFAVPSGEQHRFFEGSDAHLRR